MTMKLYYSPGSCSFSPHVVLREAGLPFDLARVDLRTKKTANGDEFEAINPKGYVPALEIENGQVLTEGAVIVQYIADKKPEAKLAPPAGTLERYRLQEWLNFVATEVHKRLGSLFANPPEEVRKSTVDGLMKKLAYVERTLAEHGPFLLGASFGVADAYLFTVLGWTKYLKIDLSSYPRITAYLETIGDRPSVKAALEAERS